MNESLGLPLPSSAIELDLDELRGALELMRFAASDERNYLGHLFLRSEDGRRRWFATDSVWAVRRDGGVDDRTYEVLIPGRLLVPALAVADSTSVKLSVQDGDEGPNSLLVLEGGHGRTELRRPDGALPPVKDFLDVPSPAPAVVDGRALVEAASALARPPFEWDDNVVGSVEIDSGALVLETGWDGIGRSAFTLPAPGAVDRPGRLVNANRLFELTRLFQGETEVRLPDAGELELVELRQEGLTAMLVGFRPNLENVRERVEEVLQQTFGPDALFRDTDGDYVLKSAGSPVFARLVDGDPAHLSLFCSLISDVELSEDLLRELNDHNVNLNFARLTWDQGLVVCRAELVAGTMDPDELFTAFRRVDTVSTELSPMLSAVFGGQTADAGPERWEAYLQTVITAEVLPGTRAILTGPEAISEWILPEVSHVITAWNPYNIPVGDIANDAENTNLAVALSTAGCRFVDARGSSPDGVYGEDSFLVWGLTREEAVSIGDRFRQEAVFEITAEELRLIHCQTGEVSTINRTHA